MDESAKSVSCEKFQVCVRKHETTTITTNTIFVQKFTLIENLASGHKAKRLAAGATAAQLKQDPCLFAALATTLLCCQAAFITTSKRVILTRRSLMSIAVVYVVDTKFILYILKV
ncbi:hypothetical protein GQX74_012795 [Glossina fuscipes]|nr:hypothetical protein GQX74_012795 [Glossina fuscipes]